MFCVKLATLKASSAYLAEATVLVERMKVRALAPLTHEGKSFVPALALQVPGAEACRARKVPQRPARFLPSCTCAAGPGLAGSAR